MEFHGDDGKVYHPSSRRSGMRIILWNIRAGGGCRVGAILDQLSVWAPDVVALCEFRGTPPSCELARGLARQGLPHSGTPPLPATRPAIGSSWPLAGPRAAPAPPPG